jgi:hypothetical protein
LPRPRRPAIWPQGENKHDQNPQHAPSQRRFRARPGTGRRRRAGADYTVSVEPNYPAGQAQKVYKPLLDYLSKATGERFVLKTSGNYHVFWRDLRAATPVDFAFEEAHFTDYRVNHQRFTPLARVADPTKYVLLVDGSNQGGGANGLIGTTHRQHVGAQHGLSAAWRAVQESHRAAGDPVRRGELEGRRRNGIRR